MSRAIERQWCGDCYKWHCTEPDSTRHESSAWSRLEALVPKGGYISLSGPNRSGHYNVAVYDGTTHVSQWVTINGKPGLEESVPFQRGYGPTPALALRDALVVVK